MKGKRSLAVNEAYLGAIFMMVIKADRMIQEENLNVRIYNHTINEAFL